MRYRRATSDDAGGLGEVHVEGWRWGYRGLLPDADLAALDPVERAAKWAEWLGPDAPDDSFVIVAEDDAGVCGFVSAGATRDDDVRGGAEVYAIYLAGRAASRGVGRVLLERAEHELRCEGFTEAVLWVLATNDRARAFYDKRGWHADGATKTDPHRCGAQPQVRYRRAL